MKRDAANEEWRALFSAMTDGKLTGPEMTRLEEILASDPEARRQWFLHCDIETGLADWASIQGSGAVIRPPKKRLATVWRVAAAITLLAGLAGVWLAVSGPLEQPRSGVARLSRIVDGRWADGIERPAGSLLTPGELSLKSGAALLEFFDGARVVIDAPATLRLVSAGEAFLESGKIRAQVPPQARGFTIGTPAATVVDHGTEFALAVPESGSEAAAELHVFEGRVDLVVPQEASALEYRGGQGAAFSLRSGAPVTPIAVDPAAFLTEDELARREEAARRLGFAAWQEASRKLSADPAAVMHFRFDTPTAANAVRPDGESGNIVGGDWTIGRWPGKPALQLGGEIDRVRFTVPEAMEAVTLIAWVRVDALPRWQNVLMAASTEVPGSLHWHLTQRGELRLEIARDLGRARADWEAVNSKPFLTPEHLGRWTMLATTFDGQTIRHYGDGQAIGEGASFTPPALCIGLADLGNWSGETQRHLAAAVDEFVILSRVLSSDELRACFEAGWSEKGGR
jgi:hypothetical protein